MVDQNTLQQYEVLLPHSKYLFLHVVKVHHNSSLLNTLLVDTNLVILLG